MIYKFSKRVTILYRKDTYSAEDQAKVFLNRIVDQGLPYIIILDRDKKFISTFQQGVFKSLGV